MSTNRGQSLIEVLIAVGVGAAFIIGAGGLIVPTLSTSKQTVNVRATAALGKELLDNVKGWASGNWNSVIALATGSANIYYLNDATSTFAVVGSGSSVQAITIGTSTYKRYFYLTSVYRDSNGNITSSVLTYDPSTILANIVVNISSTKPGPSTTFQLYLTRNSNNVISQSDWTGGQQTTSTSLMSNTIATSVSATINVSGQIQLAAYGGGSCKL